MENSSKCAQIPSSPTSSLAFRLACPAAPACNCFSLSFHAAMTHHSSSRKGWGVNTRAIDTGYLYWPMIRRHFFRVMKYYLGNREGGKIEAFYSCTTAFALIVVGDLFRSGRCRVIDVSEINCVMTEEDFCRQNRRGVKVVQRGCSTFVRPLTECWSLSSWGYCQSHHHTEVITNIKLSATISGESNRRIIQPLCYETER
jgi:hypothetical protein